MPHGSSRGRSVADARQIEAMGGWCACPHGAPRSTRPRHRECGRAFGVDVEQKGHRAPRDRATGWPRSGQPGAAHLARWGGSVRGHPPARVVVTSVSDQVARYPRVEHGGERAGLPARPCTSRPPLSPCFRSPPRWRRCGSSWAGWRADALHETLVRGKRATLVVLASMGMASSSGDRPALSNEGVRFGRRATVPPFRAAASAPAVAVPRLRCRLRTWPPRGRGRRGGLLSARSERRCGRQSQRWPSGGRRATTRYRCR